MIIIFSCVFMANNQILYILENETLGTWWVGKMTSPGRAVSQNELNDKLYKKYPNLNPYLTLVSNEGELHGVERWLSKLLYRINKEPEKLQDLKRLLMAGWDYGDTIETSTLTIISGDDNLFKLLVKYREGMTRCLNNAKFQTYQEKKSDPEFLKRISREKVLKNMKKTGKLPKPSTCEKYQIKDDDTTYIMEEVCQPIVEPPKFYKKGKKWYCPCNKKTNICLNNECKLIGLRIGIKVGGSICEHNKVRSECKECGGGRICEHGRRRSECKECGGSQICEHDRRRSQCKECGGGSICEHGRNRSRCKECGGGSICEHGRHRSRCKECGGGSICEHGRQRSKCKECGGGSICEHNKVRSYCKECGGGSICEHGRVSSICKECGGGSICEHGRHRSSCKECGGGSICEHGRVRSRCKECGGGSICEHGKKRSCCKVCSPHGYIVSLRRARRWKAINSPNPTHTLDDLCMTSKEWKTYLDKTFEDRYGRPKTVEDEVHIDEIIPCSAWDLPNDNKYCWHYLNSQLLLAEDNLSKHDSYEEEDKLDMMEKIQSSL